MKARAYYREVDLRYRVSAENRRLFIRIAIICLFIVVLLVLSSYLVWIIERNGNHDNSIRTFEDSIWWAIVTIATVGYGDKVPGTHTGRLVGMVLIIFGFVLLSVFTGLIASIFVEDKIKGAKGLKQIRSNHHIIICGWNNTAESMLKALVEKNSQSIEICLVNNQSPEHFESVETRFCNLQLKFVRGEPTQEAILRRASINTSDQVIILADHSLSSQSADDRSVIIANAVHYNAPKAKITVQLINSENKNLLQRIGVSNLIVYDDIGGYILANNVLEQNSLNLFSSLAKSRESSIITCEISEDFIGKSYSELFEHIHKEQNCLVLGLISKETVLDIETIFSDNTSAIDQFIKQNLNMSGSGPQEEKNNIRWNPEPDTMIQDNDFAILLSSRVQS
ncbi:MAG: hypothetical protein CVU48_04210 [Candidatus Cloacimonetes bacterium HGW-Cloacimonetes-1]|nr:MAG: hypothetical protein CVU48_04210 [Candidatus Cloacimonetes bacterium HGW-Cloacimonetes-1]